MDLDSLEKAIIYHTRELKKSGFGRLEVVISEHKVNRVYPHPAYDSDALVAFTEKAESAGTLTQ